MKPAPTCKAQNPHINSNYLSPKNRNEIVKVKRKTTNFIIHHLKSEHF